jgi:hypothetical protein
MGLLFAKWIVISFSGYRHEARQIPSSPRREAADEKKTAPFGFRIAAFA